MQDRPHEHFVVPLLSFLSLHFLFSLYSVRNMLQWLMYLELTLWSCAAFSLLVARPHWFKAKNQGWSYRDPLGDSSLLRSWLSIFGLVFLAAVRVALKAPSLMVLTALTRCCLILASDCASSFKSLDSTDDFFLQRLSIAYGSLPIPPYIDTSHTTEHRFHPFPF